VDEIAAGLWRWTAPHPEWIPDAAPDSTDDWGRDVGCVLYVTDDAAVFIDPLVPDNARRFWSWADRQVAERRTFVLTTVRPHRRSRAQVAARYRASVSRAKRNLPSAVEPIALRGAGETVFWLPEKRSLVPGDRILGAGEGRLRLCPESWLHGVRADRRQLHDLLTVLLELPIERVLVSHGEPVLEGGRAALSNVLSPGNP
jgi:hypothetical protein